MKCKLNDYNREQGFRCRSFECKPCREFMKRQPIRPPKLPPKPKGPPHPIRALRKSKKKSQVEFSKEILISQGYLSKVENGECHPNFFMLHQLREIYKANLNKLVAEIINWEDKK